MKLAFLFSLIPMLSFGMDRISALSMLETGDNDQMIGRAGEISRYQVLKTEWKAVTPSTNYTDPVISKQIAVKILEQRVQRFKTVFNRAPTDFEFYALWNAPGQVFGARISHVVAERAQRFANLCDWNPGRVARLQRPSKSA